MRFQTINSFISSGSESPQQYTANLHPPTHVHTLSTHCSHSLVLSDLHRHSHTDTHTPLTDSSIHTMKREMVWSTDWMRELVYIPTDGRYDTCVRISRSVCVCTCVRVLIEFRHVSQTTSNSIGKLINLISKEWKRRKNKSFHTDSQTQGHTLLSPVAGLLFCYYNSMDEMVWGGKFDLKFVD